MIMIIYVNTSGTIHSLYIHNTYISFYDASSVVAQPKPCVKESSLSHNRMGDGWMVWETILLRSDQSVIWYWLFYAYTHCTVSFLLPGWPVIANVPLWRLLDVDWVGFVGECAIFAPSSSIFCFDDSEVVGRLQRALDLASEQCRESDDRCSALTLQITESEASMSQLKIRLESETKAADREGARARELAKKLL